MIISLTIDNVDKLPNGGPLGYRSHGDGFEIGRENCHWNLPDPDLFISGRHCEVRYQQGAFWLHDISRNGTFVNGSNHRVENPYRLGDGDRLRIGRYIVSVSIEAEPSSAESDNVWGIPASPRRSAPAEPFGGGSSSPANSGERPRPARLPRTDDFSMSFKEDPFLAPAPRRIDRQPPAAQVRLQAMGPAPTPPGKSGEAANLLASIAAGAGVSPDVFGQRDPQDVAAEIGAVLRILVDELALLLKARTAAKALAKSGHRTMIGSADNNPLKFVPGSEEILEKMFARRGAGYLDAKHSIEEAFRDLKTHEIATYSAMQSALSRLLDDLSPDAIGKKLAPSAFASKKGRAWDAFIATWEAREAAHENGMLDVFLAYFSEAYAKAAKQK